MSLSPIRDRILVNPASVETKTASGLYIPDSATDGPIKGTVISTGTGRITEDGTIVPLVVSNGDTVLYVQGAGSKVKDNGEEYIILTEDQILAIVE